MAFTVEDFQDLLALLRAHPDWLGQLRALILTEELLRLPAEFRSFREEMGAFRRETEVRFQRVEAQIAALAEAQRRHYEEFVAYRVETDRRLAALQEEVAAARAEADRRFAELAEAQRRTEERVGRLEEAVAALAEAQRRHYEEFAAHREEFLAYRTETDRRFAELAEAIRRLTGRVEDLDGRLRGLVHEDRYRTRLRRYRRLVDHPYVLSPAEREALLRAAEAAGRLSPEEADDLDEADVIVRGWARGGEGEVYLVVEVSGIVHPEDLLRAVNRAAALRKAVPEAEVLAVVAGPEIHPDAAPGARNLGVWWIKDGRAFAPHEIPVRPE